MLWTDTFQMIVVIVGIFVLLILGANDAGGFGRVWRIADENGRLEFDKYVRDARSSMRKNRLGILLKTFAGRVVQTFPANCSVCAIPLSSGYPMCDTPSQSLGGGEGVLKNGTTQLNCSFCIAASAEISERDTRSGLRRSEPRSPTSRSSAAIKPSSRDSSA